ncbi:hypothetical protein CR513_47162, partial [Mucuna pruriens]
MATLLPIIEIKIMLSMLNGKSKMHNSCLGFHRCLESSTLPDCHNNVGLLEETRQFHIITFNHDSLFISDFCSQFMNLWAKYADIIYASLNFKGLSSIQIVHETTKRDQFHMKLRSSFESIWSNLMHKDLIPSLDVCLNDLLCEEQRLLTKSIIEE